MTTAALAAQVLAWVLIVAAVLLALAVVVGHWIATPDDDEPAG